MRKLWKLGIGTVNSCQAHCKYGCTHKKKENCKSQIWLAFESTKDLEALYNCVAEYSQDESSVYCRMGADRFFTLNTATKWSRIDDWDCAVIMRNHGVKYLIKNDMWIEDGCAENNFIMQPQITFPIKDLPYVEKRLSAAIAKLK